MGLCSFDLGMMDCIVLTGSRMLVTLVICRHTPSSPSSKNEVLQSYEPAFRGQALYLASLGCVDQRVDQGGPITSPEAANAGTANSYIHPSIPGLIRPPMVQLSLLSEFLLFSLALFPL
jgi:hypothetical protein